MASGRVLIVDDDPSVLGWMLRIVRDAGYEAIGVGHVADARAVVGPFAALVVDIGLPNGQPKDVAIAHPGVPMLTVSGDHSKRPDLRKPFTSSELAQAVGRLVPA